MQTAARVFGAEIPAEGRFREWLSSVASSERFAAGSVERIEAERLAAQVRAFDHEAAETLALRRFEANESALSIHDRLERLIEAQMRGETPMSRNPRPPTSEMVLRTTESDRTAAVQVPRTLLEASRGVLARRGGVGAIRTEVETSLRILWDETEKGRLVWRDVRRALADFPQSAVDWRNPRQVLEQLDLVGRGGDASAALLADKHRAMILDLGELAKKSEWASMTREQRFRKIEQIVDIYHFDPSEELVPGFRPPVESDASTTFLPATPDESERMGQLLEDAVTADLSEMPPELSRMARIRGKVADGLASSGRAREVLEWDATKSGWRNFKEFRERGMQCVSEVSAAEAKSAASKTIGERLKRSLLLNSIGIGASFIGSQLKMNVQGGVATPFNPWVAGYDLLNNVLFSVLLKGRVVYPSTQDKFWTMYLKGNAYDLFRAHYIEPNFYRDYMAVANTVSHYLGWDFDTPQRTEENAALRQSYNIRWNAATSWSSPTIFKMVAWYRCLAFKNGGASALAQAERDTNLWQLGWDAGTAITYYLTRKAYMNQ